MAARVSTADDITYYDNPDSDDSDQRDTSSQASDYHYAKPKTDVKAWDKFEAHESEATSASEQNTDLIKLASVALKVLTVVITFLVVLTSTVVAKGATFFIISQASRNRLKTEFCLNNFDNDSANVTLQPNMTYVAFNKEEDSVAWYWCIFFVFLGPELLALGRSLRVCLMRKTKQPKWMTMIIVAVFETLHILGLAILFFVALPQIDSVRGLMATSGVLVIPGLHKVFCQRNKKPWQNWTALGLTIISLLFQLAGLFLWLIFNSNWKEYEELGTSAWALPVGLFLTSFAWWETFADRHSISPVSKFLWRIKTAMIEEDERYRAYVFVSLWKIVSFLGFFIGFAKYTGAVSDAGQLFQSFASSFRGEKFAISPIDDPDDIQEILVDPTYLPIKVLAVQISMGYLSYIFGKFACKVNIQRVSFALPFYLATPTAVGILIGLCNQNLNDECVYLSGFPRGFFYECPEIDSIFSGLAGWVWILWILSQFWITSHVWTPKSIRLASTEQMFGTPYYSGLLPEQSILLNRRKDSGRLVFRAEILIEGGSGPSGGNGRPGSKSSFGSFGRFGFGRQKSNSDQHIYEDVDGKREKKISRFGSHTYEGQVTKEDEKIRVYGCATMWHENSEEMDEMLKSIFRMDEDYCARLYATEHLGIPDSDFFEWETHIFFDDAFEPDDTGKLTVVNQFVRDLVDRVDDQGKKWYGSRNMKVPNPVRCPTPYGGRLVWILPGRTKIVCHLKDKNKIRHKKRWSQCMYMYYFLGYMLEANDNLSQAQKDIRARNTFLLALDGDVDFQPEAITKLIDLMKRNPDIGASCGRIHPTGSGYMQWYQMFEYAIGHWLQKSTEHIMGCVLCSPGCFSLFRGKALMDDNVAKTYTTVSTEPRHFIQYDQGEDRWLCTLLLQQGWRVEYSAASDSFTACPQGFGEFYNQRRRWMPSTIANIMDLLGDYKRVMRNNDDISIFYIVYQVMMMIGTILGPGSIYIMLCGALGVAFGMDNWTSFLVNLVPLTAFIIICFYAKSNHQIVAAQILSVAYALVMMAVLIGMLVQVAEDGWLAPSTLSLLFVTFTFVLAGLLHPQELACLPMGVIYYITIPSMYLFLTIYSVFNLNVVSWGTREVPKKKTADELEQERQEAEEQAKNAPVPKPTFLSKIFGNSSLEFSMSRVFRKTDDQENILRTELNQMTEKLDRIESALRKDGYKFENQKQDKPVNLPEPKSQLIKRSPTVRIVDPKDNEIRDDLKNPYWIEQKSQVGDGPLKYLPRGEVSFWVELIDQYLKPLEKDAKAEKQMGDALKELRNQMVFSFLMINSIWCLTIFLLQENKDLLYVEWPIGPEGPEVSYVPGPLGDTEESTIYVDYTYLQLEPIGLVFLIFFAVVLLIQLIGMLMHRVMTLGHIVSTTSVKMHLFKKKDKDLDGDAFINKHGVQMIKNMAKQYQPDDRETPMTMTDLMNNAVEAATTDTSGRRLSDALSVRNPSVLKRKATVKALARRHSEAKKRETIRRVTEKPDTIDEEEDDYGSRHHPIVRTNTFKDPEGLPEREV